MMEAARDASAGSKSVEDRGGGTVDKELLLDLVLRVRVTFATFARAERIIGR